MWGVNARSGFFIFGIFFALSALAGAGAFRLQRKRWNGLSTILRAVGGLLWRTDVLHGFPLFKCHFDRQKISMLAVIGVLLDRSARPCESATTCQTNGIFRENVR